MGKIDEARELLKMLGMPKAQQADICCYVLLAMAGIKQDTLWKDAGNEWIRIHDIIGLRIHTMDRLMQKTVGKLFASRHCTIFGTLHLLKIMEKLQTVLIIGTGLQKKHCRC